MSQARAASDAGRVRPPDTLLCATDDSARGAESVEVASALAERAGLRLLLAHREGGSRSDAGDAAARLADTARECGARLLVVASRGRGALRAAVLGSVSRELVACAPCPVVVVPPGAGDALTAHDRERPLGVLCGIDDDPERTPAIVAHAAGLAARLDARLVLAHFEGSVELAVVPGAAGVHPGFAGAPHAAQRRRAARVLAAAEEHAERAPSVSVRAEVGDPEHGLDPLAERAGCALLVVGAHRRGTLAAVALGSVSAALAAHARRPVAIVGPAARAGGGSDQAADAAASG